KKFQTFIKIIINFIHNNIKNIYHNKNKIITPLTLTIFI
ncbi:F0F1 ATP synthase subunit A, partial [Bacillus thuringiensis]|nr:F0F1 ATP synthase subunit A [Bacillus thuringiensis]